MSEVLTCHCKGGFSVQTVLESESEQQIVMHDFEMSSQDRDISLMKLFNMRNQKKISISQNYNLCWLVNKHLISQNRIEITVFSSLKVFCWNIPILFWDSLATASTSLYLYENGQCCSPHVTELTVYCPSLIQNSHSFTGSSLEFYAQRDILHIAIESRECISHWIFLISCIPTKYTDWPPQVSCRQCRARELFARYSSQSMDSY